MACEEVLESPPDILSPGPLTRLLSSPGSPGCLMCPLSVSCSTAMMGGSLLFLCSFLVPVILAEGMYSLRGGGRPPRVCASAYSCGNCWRRIDLGGFLACTVKPGQRLRSRIRSSLAAFVGTCRGGGGGGLGSPLALPTELPRYGCFVCSFQRLSKRKKRIPSTMVRHKHLYLTLSNISEHCCNLTSLWSSPFPPPPRLPDPADWRPDFCRGFLHARDPAHSE